MSGCSALWDEGADKGVGVLISRQVGLHNQRHFVLFMAWLSIATWVVVAMGYTTFWDSLNFRVQVSWS